ncbi:MAG: thiamine phosphate synthase [Spirochaetales bacterium]|nr:thiamine phosphate synthase [Spirochaetales bacterium]
MKDRFGIYVILTNPLIGYEKCAEAAIKAEVAFLQLRMKHTPVHRVLKTAMIIKDLTAGTHTQFIVNDDVRIAAEVHADGVHLGQDDMSIEEARAFWNEPGKIFGFSTHSPKQAKDAFECQPDYIGVGPVYKTPTKAIPDPELGLACMGNIIRSTSLPAVAIGGITLENIRRVLQAGAINFSAVRAIMESADPFKVIREFQSIWEEYVGC